MRINNTDVFSYLNKLIYQGELMYFARDLTEKLVDVMKREKITHPVKYAKSMIWSGLTTYKVERDGAIARIIK